MRRAWEWLRMNRRRVAVVGGALGAVACTFVSAPYNTPCALVADLLSRAVGG